MLQNDRRLPGTKLLVTKQEIAGTPKNCGCAGYVVNLTRCGGERHYLGTGSARVATKSPHIYFDLMFTRQKFPLVIADPRVGKSSIVRFAVHRYDHGRTAP